MSSPGHFQLLGTTPHRHEQEGLAWLGATLPTYGPFGGYALFSFQTDDGRRYEIDAIAMTAHCLYVIEMKAWRGDVVEGDARHLVTVSSGRRREVVDHPLPLLEVKTKALADRVRRIARRMGPEVADKLAGLWFEPLVWLTHADRIKLGDHDAARSHVIGKQELGDALRQGRFPGARDDLRSRSNSHETLKALRRVLAGTEFGLARIEKPLTVLDGRFDLVRLIDEGDDYQDHWAEPHGVGPGCRVRSYLAPRSDRAFVQKLDRRVEREAKILLRLGDHPDILALEQFDPKGPLGPALVFRGFPGQSLDAFVKEQRGAEGRSSLSVDDKLGILRRVADALAFCHRSDVVHGALSPEAVLVHRAEPAAPIQVRLTRFALAAAGDPASDGTRLFTRLAGASANSYEAPEVARGALATPASDLFSLGALAYYLLAETPPAQSSAELGQRLERDGALVISAVRDDLFPAGALKNLDMVLRAATALDPTARTADFSTLLDFVDMLEDALTAPTEIAPEPPPSAAAAPETDPLTAAKGDLLGGDLRVLGELGSGASARVFKVRHPAEGEVALKVPLADAHDERIAQEGEVLERLRRTPGVDRIAHFVGLRSLAGRTCLLVQLAGDHTLADEIRTEGALSLDYARRWGDDLLTALRSLEEAGIQHRDIKPANIGLTSGAEKGKKRLLLFDFSLSQRPATDLGIGTPAYRDPELTARGRWDDAADRWAAAITLHEMFTGVRPAPLLGTRSGGTAVRVDPDRFDAAVRDGLVRFFDRAFRASARQRFVTADDMRDAFIQALHNVPEHESGGEATLDAAALKGLGPEARVSELPLSTREQNALDRMGIYTLHELAQLSGNRLGGVRGVGARTARSLVDLARVVREHLEMSSGDVAPPFLRGFHGARRTVEEECASCLLSAPLAERLIAAGLDNAAAVASAPQAQVRNLVARARKDGAPESVKDLTAWLEGLIDADRVPTTLGAAVELLAPSHGKAGPTARKRVRQLLGLEDLEGFPRHGSMGELAAALGKTRALVSIDVGKARDRWLGEADTSLETDEVPPKTREQAVLERAFAAVTAALSASVGVIPVARAAAAILEVLPPEPDLSPEAAKRGAEALVRALTLIDAQILGGPEDGKLQLRRVARPDAPDALAAWDRGGFDLALALGTEADALVAGDAVIAEAAAAARLRDALGKGIAGLDAARAEQARALQDRALVTLASATSARARLSVRGELYPAGLPTERAVLLSAAAIAGDIDLRELERRVRARYPESAPFPEDPAVLEALAGKLGMRFDAARGALVQRERTQGHGSTELWSRSSGGGAASSVVFRPRLTRAEGDVVGATAVRIFDEELDRAMRDGAFRVLLWRGMRAGGGRPLGRGAPDAEHAAHAVARRLGVQARSADALLLDAAEAVAAEKKLRGGLTPAIQADDRGPDGASWPRLLDLMRLAAERCTAEILASAAPLVLTRLGLLGRYDLLSVVAEVATAHRAPVGAGGRAARFVVLPVYAGESAVVEVGSDVAARVGASAGTFLVPVPGVLPHEIIEVPAAWMERAATLREATSGFPAAVG